MNDGIPWWLGGEEICSFCFGSYAYEIEVRCVECDRPSCPHCVMLVRRHHEPRCLECDEPSQEL